MIRVLPIIAAVVLMVYCLVDCAQTRSDDVRQLPKPVWLFLIIIPILGGVGWLLFGRPVTSPPPPPSGGLGRAVRRPPVAPDDDPTFLAKLDESSRDLRGMDEWEQELQRPDEPGDDGDAQRVRD